MSAKSDVVPVPLSRGAGLATVLLTLVCWSSVPLFLRHFAISATPIDAWTSNGWRYGFAALIWAPVVLWGCWRRTLPRGIFKAALVPGIANSVGQVFYTWAHYRIDPGLLSFGLRTQILFVAGAAYILFPGERRLVRSPWFWAGIALVLGGTAGTVLLGQGTSGTAHFSGFGMAVLSGFFFAVYYVSVRQYMSEYPSLVSFAVVSQYTAAAMVTLMVLVGADHGMVAARLPGGEFALLLVSAVIGIALGHVLYFISIKRLGVAVSSGVLQIQPICIAAASTVLFHELLTGAQWISGAIAVSGALVILVLEQRLAHLPAPELAPALEAEPVER